MLGVSAEFTHGRSPLVREGKLAKACRRRKRENISTYKLGPCGRDTYLFLYRPRAHSVPLAEKYIEHHKTKVGIEKRAMVVAFTRCCSISSKLTIELGDRCDNSSEAVARTPGRTAARTRIRDMGSRGSRGKATIVRVGSKR